jgi:multicopper oxidase
VADRVGGHRGPRRAYRRDLDLRRPAARHADPGEGRRGRARHLDNRLPAPTSIHWHGLALRNDADGVPGVTQPTVPPGGRKAYEFTAADPGTYWFHPHHGVQLDRGLYAPLIVEDPREPLGYDDEWVVVLDDWLDGADGTPDDVLAELRQGMGGMDMGGTTMGGHALTGAGSDLLGGDAGDVRYPYFLINGRRPQAPAVYRGRPGTRLRLRIINAGGDTAFRVALGGHRLTVTHTDGYPVRHAPADALLIGMGERYDVLVTLADGVFPLVAAAEGKNAAARPRERSAHGAGAGDLRPADAVRLPDKTPDRTVRLELTGGMERYDWAVNGRPYDPCAENCGPKRSTPTARRCATPHWTPWRRWSPSAGWSR